MGLWRKETSFVSRQRETETTSICIVHAYQFQVGGKRQLILKFLTFFDVLNYIRQEPFSLHFLKSFHRTSTAMVGQQWLTGRREWRATGWDSSKCVRSYMGNHGYLLAPAWRDQSDAADQPCRGKLHQLLPCVRGVSLVLRKTKRDCKTQDFPTHMRKKSHAWNRWDSGKICIWSRSYARIVHQSRTLHSCDIESIV